MQGSASPFNKCRLKGAVMQVMHKKRECLAILTLFFFLNSIPLFADPIATSPTAIEPVIPVTPAESPAPAAGATTSASTTTTSTQFLEGETLSTVVVVESPTATPNSILQAPRVAAPVAMASRTTVIPAMADMTSAITIARANSTTAITAAAAAVVSGATGNAAATSSPSPLPSPIPPAPVPNPTEGILPPQIPKIRPLEDFIEDSNIPDRYKAPTDSQWVYSERREPESTPEFQYYATGTYMMGAIDRRDHFGGNLRLTVELKYDYERQRWIAQSVTGHIMEFFNINDPNFDGPNDTYIRKDTLTYAILLADPDPDAAFELVTYLTDWNHSLSRTSHSETGTSKINEVQDDSWRIFNPDTLYMVGHYEDLGGPIPPVAPQNHDDFFNNPDLAPLTRINGGISLKIDGYSRSSRTEQSATEMKVTFKEITYCDFFYEGRRGVGGAATDSVTTVTYEAIPGANPPATYPKRIDVSLTKNEDSIMHFNYSIENTLYQGKIVPAHFELSFTDYLANTTQLMTVDWGVVVIPLEGRPEMTMETWSITNATPSLPSIYDLASWIFMVGRSGFNPMSVFYLPTILGYLLP